MSRCHDSASHPQDDQEQQGVKVHRVERSQSFVRRSLRLPEYADLSKVQVGVCAPCGYACLAVGHCLRRCVSRLRVLPAVPSV